MTSVNRARLTAKRLTKECRSAGATPDTSGRPKIRNRCRARVSKIKSLLYRGYLLHRTRMFIIYALYNRSYIAKIKTKTISIVFVDD